MRLKLQITYPQIVKFSGSMPKLNRKICLLPGDKQRMGWDDQMRGLITIDQVHVRPGDG